MITLVVTTLIIILASGCAVRTYGYYSLPYTTDSPPHHWSPRFGQIAIPRGGLVSLPDSTLYLSLDNHVESGKYFWVFFPRPLRGSTPDIWKDLDRSLRGSSTPDIWKDLVAQDWFCISTELTPLINGISFDISRVILEIDGKKHSAYHQSAGVNENAPESHPVILPKNILKKIRFCFEENKPSPRQDIVLYLDGALIHPSGKKITPIKFRRQLWVFDIVA